MTKVKVQNFLHRTISFLSKKNDSFILLSMAEPKELKPKHISDIFSHIFDRRTRILDESEAEIVEKVLSSLAPSKLKITTLSAVFEAFYSKWKGLAKKDVDAVYFNYDELLWKATIKKEHSFYEDRCVEFTNIKLPNGGFFYTEEYIEKGYDTRMIENEECMKFVDDIAKKVVEFEIVDVDAAYFQREQKVALYFWNDNRDQCITVKFEYGYHNGTATQNRPQFTQLLARLKKK